MIAVKFLVTPVYKNIKTKNYFFQRAKPGFYSFFFYKKSNEKPLRKNYIFILNESIL